MFVIFLQILYSFFFDDETNLIFKDLITGILNIFFSCVASEIIILNFCELDKNTKKEIKKRAGTIYFSDLVDVSSEID